MKKSLYALGIIVALGALWFAYYAISPLFRHVRVDETAPQVQAPNTKQPEQMQNTSAVVVGTAGHPASGTVRILEAEGKKYVRYENFNTINGPDLYIYLAKDLGAKEYVDLGTLRATEGNINYEIPGNVDPSDYRYVMTWCKQFGVLFNYADISKQ